MNNCIFCRIITREIPAGILKETDDLIVIKDIAPKASVHLLIIPKVHVSDIQSLNSGQFAVGAKIFEVAQELSKTVPGAEHFKLVINNGRGVGQQVFHLHAHFLSGKLSELV